MNNLFAELKRRNVVRVAIAYAVVSWAILQFVDIIEPILGLPGWFPKVAFTLLLIGLPIALLLSWAYEVTPEGVMKTEEVDKSKSITHGTGQRINKLIAGGLVLALAFIIYDKTIEGNGVSEAVAGQASIAVLPFVNMSDDASNEYFADGLSEELLNVLAKVPNLKVAGRTSSFQFKGKTPNFSEVGEILGVDHILEGSVRKQGNRVRITAQLIRASDGFHMWSETYDRNLEDIFAVQDEISAAIFDKLSVALGLEGEAPRRAAPTTNMDAYDRYLEARTLIARRGGENLTRAIRLLEEAIQLDPGFASAWAGLGQALDLAPYYGAGDFATFIPRAQVAALRAIELDPNLGSGHSALADSLRDQQRWAEAEAEYKIAIALSPNEAEVNSQYSQLLVRVGKSKEALPYTLRAGELDPLSMIPPAVGAISYHLNGDHDNETIFLNKSLALDNIGFSNYAGFILALSHNNISDQRTFLTKAYEMQIKEMKVSKVLEFLPLLDKADRARVLLHELFAFEKAKGENKSFGVLVIFAFHFGEFDLGVEILQWQRTQTTSIYDTIWLWPILTPELMQHAGFRAALETSGIVDYWRSNGFPPGCRVVSDVDYECE